jgi:hypothetical protein
VDVDHAGRGCRWGRPDRSMELLPIWHPSTSANLAAMVPPDPCSFAPEEVRAGSSSSLTPGKSLFVWAPATLLACWRCQAGGAARAAAGLALATVTVRAVAAYRPEGGYAHGPRHGRPLTASTLRWPCLTAWNRRRLRRAIGSMAASHAVSFLEATAPACRRDLIRPYSRRVRPGPAVAATGSTNILSARAEAVTGVPSTGRRRRAGLLRPAPAPPSRCPSDRSPVEPGPSSFVGARCCGPPRVQASVKVPMNDER